MQCASPERTEFMSKETFIEALKFAKYIHSSVVMISGGEPTSHPLFFEFIDELFSGEWNFVSTAVLSNGTFLKNHEFAERLAEYTKRNSNFFVQVSSFKGLYDNYDYVHKPGLKALRLFGSQINVCDDSSEFLMKPLGRASSGPYYEEAKRLNGFPSCANSCLILTQLKEKCGKGDVGALMERCHRFCLPIVSWNGSIRLGEAEQCKVVANISEPIETVNKKMFGFRPCGGCDSYKWHFQNPRTQQEKDICKTLWPER